MSNTHLFSSYKHYKHDKQFDAIIIGSGISGLALGAILSKDGKKVLVLEQHYTPGGFTHTFKRNDYEWDVGVHYVGEVGKQTLLKSVYDYVCDTPIEWADMGEVYDRIFFGEESFEFRKGRKAFVAYFSNLFPDEKQNLEKYLELVNELSKNARGYYAEKAFPEIAGKLVGGFMRSKYLRYASRTTREVMNELFKDAKLKAILEAQFGDYGLPPSEGSFAMHAVIAKHYMNGGFYPVGGSGVFFEKIAPVITRAGGEIMIRAAVSEILVEGDKAVGVKMADGKEIRAEKVISTAGVDNTYYKLLPQATQAKLNLAKRTEGTRPSLSYFCLYVGFQHTAAEMNFPKSNLWIFPKTFDHDANLYNYLDGKSTDIPGVYISFPGAKDPSFETRYPGRSTVEVICITRYDDFKKWEDTRWKHRGEEYDALKEKISKQLLEYLYKYVPQTQGKIDYHELSTPLSVKHFAAYQKGEMYGIDHNPSRFNNRYLKPRTPIKNLFLAGQDIVSCGVGGGLMSAVICASAMSNSNYVDKIMKAVNQPAAIGG
ncbi:MAG: NAD(P)/FAD-dependent oxidoreductase [Chitinophagales bacterium]